MNFSPSGTAMRDPTPRETIRVSCDYCSSSHSCVKAQIQDYQIVTCTSCGLSYTQPQPTEEVLVRLYDRRSYFIKYSGASWDPAWARSYHEELARIEYFLPEGRNLLEVGCGGGEFLRCAGERGWVATGQDITSVAVERAATFGVKIHPQPLTELYFSKAQFDTIAMFHVLEHVPRPGEFLQQCIYFLRPGGLLVIGVPIINSIDLYFDAELREKTQHIPFHLYHFSRRTLLNYLESFGVTPVMIDAGVADTVRRILRRPMPPEKSLESNADSRKSLAAIRYITNPTWKKLLRSVVSRVFPYPYLVVYARKPQGG